MLLCTVGKDVRVVVVVGVSIGPMEFQIYATQSTLELAFH